MREKLLRPGLRRLNLGSNYRNSSFQAFLGRFSKKGSNLSEEPKFEQWQNLAKAKNFPPLDNKIIKPPKPFENAKILRRESSGDDKDKIRGGFKVPDGGGGQEIWMQQWLYLISLAAREKNRKGDKQRQQLTTKRRSKKKIIAMQ